MYRYFVPTRMHLASVLLALLAFLLPALPGTAQPAPNIVISWSNIEPIYAGSILQSYSIDLTISNTGNADASALSLDSAPLNFVSPTAPSLPYSVGDVDAGQSVPITLTYPSSVGTPGLVVPIGAAGHFTAPPGPGSFSVSDIVELPAVSTFLTTLHYFDDSPDGGGPVASLIQAADGNLYGTTSYGGMNDTGTIFKITTSGVLTTLHRFRSTDGDEPSSLIQAADGNLYGTCVEGGTNDSGTIFKLTTSGALTTLHSFNNSDGAFPQVPLIQAADGKLYGTCWIGGANGIGTIFKITTRGAFAVIYNFSGNSNGFNPDGARPGGLIQASDGNLYGTCGDGGANGNGTIFSITTGGALTELYSFSASSGNTNSDGAGPLEALIQARDGNLYGTCNWGGLYGYGAVLCLDLPNLISPAMQLTHAALTRSSATGAITATLTLANVGYQSATNVVISGSTLGSAKTNTALPVSVGTISGPGSASVMLTYPKSAGAKGRNVSLQVAGTFTGGSFNDVLAVTLP